MDIERQEFLRKRIWDSVMTIPHCGCWIWMGEDNNFGYGRLKVGYANGSIRAIQAHRIAYEVFKGPIPEGLEIDHLCCVKFCCNPDHLEAVTPAINTQRYYEKTYKDNLIGSKWKNGFCKNGHKMISKNIKNLLKI